MLVVKIGSALFAFAFWILLLKSIEIIKTRKQLFKEIFMMLISVAMLVPVGFGMELIKNITIDVGFVDNVLFKTYIFRLLLNAPLEQIVLFLVMVVNFRLFEVSNLRDYIFGAVSIGLVWAIVTMFLHGPSQTIAQFLFQFFFVATTYAALSSLIAVAWGLYRMREKEVRSFLQFVGACAVAALLNGLYFNLALFSGISFYVVIPLINLLLFIWLVKKFSRYSPYTLFPLTDYKTAIPLLRQELAKDPHSFVLAYRLGIFYFYRKQFSRAEALLRRALLLKATSSGALLHLAALQLAMGNEKAASQTACGGVKYANKLVISRFLKAIGLVLRDGSTERAVRRMVEEAERESAAVKKKAVISISAYDGLEKDVYLSSWEDVLARAQ